MKGQTQITFPNSKVSGVPNSKASGVPKDPHSEFLNLENEDIPEGWCAGYDETPSCVCCQPADTVVLPPSKSKSLLPYSYGTLTFPRPRQIHITVGPVIGTVTSRSARVLIEVSDSCNVIMKAVGRVTTSQLRAKTSSKLVQTSTMGKHIARTSKYFTKGVPGSFELTGLFPSTHYTLFFNIPYVRLLTSSFTTRPLVDTLESAPYRIALVSGHKSFLQTEKDVTGQLNDEEYREQLKRISMKVIQYTAIKRNDYALASCGLMI